MDTSLIQTRVDTNLKHDASQLFDELGLDMSTAIKMFLKKCIQEGGIPFDVKKNTDNTMNNRGLEAFFALRKQAEENGLSGMSLEEINEEIKASRRERKDRKVN